MAILASTNWRVRAGGNALNGGGYDSAISGAGTDYTDQDSPQLSLTDFATSGAGSTTLTSATGGFTAAMVGNCVRIASGTNFQTGYYFITGYTDTNTVTVDRTPTSGGAGSGGTGRVGGAFANLAASLSTGGTVTAPTLTSPLAAGHTIWLRGGGTDTPSSADYTQSGYASYPAGTLASGRVRLIGYNGRPRIDIDNIALYQIGYWYVENLMLKSTGASNASIGRIGYSTQCVVVNVRIDMAGFDVKGIEAHTTRGCSLLNTGSTSAGTYPAIEIVASGGSAMGNYVDGWRGYGILAGGSSLANITGNIVARTKATTGPGIKLQSSSSTYRAQILRNAVYGCAGDGIAVTDDDAITEAVIANNILHGNGGYGINLSVGSTELNDRRRAMIDFNAFRSNTSGARNNHSAGSNDVTLTVDPFVDATNGDFRLNNTAGGGAALRGVAYPRAIPT